MTRPWYKRGARLGTKGQLSFAATRQGCYSTTFVAFNVASERRANPEGHYPFQYTVSPYYSQSLVHQSKFSNREPRSALCIASER